MSRFILAISMLVIATPQLTSAEPEHTKAEVVFATQVLPVLKSRCFACHGDDAKKIKGGLDLTTRATLLKGGDAGVPGIHVGKAAESPLYKAVLRTDDDISAMPPKENDKLSIPEIQAIKEWIDGGAPWPSDERLAAIAKSIKPAGVRMKTSGGLSPDWTNRTYDPVDLWAYQPLRKPPVPANTGKTNPVDAFVQAKLNDIDLSPAPLTNRRTLIRRVTFDVTGLPPTPAEIEAFVNDPDSDERAYEKVVDRLLASPQYGEQMARHWLDIARYADSSGFANDYERGNAWRYRDYVVRAFNSDKPYDQFVREQLAGDEIDPNNPEMLVAVGFLRMGAWELTGMEVAKIARQRFLDDVTDAVGQVFQGHMLQCARCHDHKFDPVPTRDYYGIQAVFSTTQLSERTAPFLKVENLSGFEEKKYLDARRAVFESELKRIQNTENAARTRWQNANPEKKGEKPPRHEFLTPADLGLERIARKGLERLQWEYDRYQPFALSVYNGATPNLKAVYAPFRMPKDRDAGEREVTSILAGGDPFSPKEAVTPGTLSAAGRAKIPNSTSGRRMAFAEWITDAKNPLTARVMANRIWQWTIGMPLAGNPNNFGATGKKPTHPEFLDWLASELIERKWSVKQLQRVLLISETYRRSSQHPNTKLLTEKDVSGTSYAIHKPRRLHAEELRDAMLAASGELNTTLGGIPVRPEINSDVAFQPRQVMGTFAPAWEPSPKPEQRNRRTLYTLKLRGVRDPFLEVFNSPPSDLSCEVREVSTVAPQAFALLNGDATRARALALAESVTRATPTPEAAITLAFQRSVGRTPKPKELEACLKHWQAMTQLHKNLQLEKPKRPKEIVREAVEENTGEKFTFKELLPAAVDFVPDRHPSDVSPEIRGLMEVCLVLFNTNEFAYLD